MTSNADRYERLAGRNPLRFRPFTYALFSLAVLVAVYNIAPNRFIPAFMILFLFSFAWIGLDILLKIAQGPRAAQRLDARRDELAA